MATCDPGTLLQAAGCFTCLDKNQLEAVESYLLCQESVRAGTNLIPNGTTYPGGAIYQLTGLTVGSLYRLINGNSGLNMNNGPQILHSVIGVPLFFTATLSILTMTGNPGDVITTSVTLISN